MAAVLVLAAGADLATVFDFTAAFFASAGFFAAVLVLADGADLATVFDFTAAFFASAGFFAAVLVLAAGADLATVFDFTAAFFASAGFFAAVLVLAAGADLAATFCFATLLSDIAAISVISFFKTFEQKILRKAQPSIRKILSEIRIAGIVSILNPSSVNFVPINALTTADTNQHSNELGLKELLFSSVFILIFLKF